MNKANQPDPDLERIKSIIAERIKKDGFPINDYWLLFILALCERKNLNAEGLCETLNELKKKIREDGEPS